MLASSPCAHSQSGQCVWCDVAASLWNPLNPEAVFPAESHQAVTGPERAGGGKQIAQLIPAIKKVAPQPNKGLTLMNVTRDRKATLASLHQK